MAAVVLGDRPFVVGRMSAVGGAHLDEPGAAGGDDVGQAKRAADLDQLSAGDNDLAAVGERVEHDRHGGGIIVDHRGCRGPGELLQQPLDPLVAAAAPAGFQVGLQQRIAGQLVGDLPHGLRRKHGAPGRCGG